MTEPRFALVLSFVLGLSGILSAKAPGDNVQELFNGKDLSNWTWISREPGVKKADIWSVKDGVLYCQGTVPGYIRTVKDDYRNYLLIVEWRWPEDGSGGNNGVLVHTSTPGELGVWPKSIEVQLGSGNAGDFWVIGTQLDVPDETTRVRGRRYLNLTNGSENPFGQWNQMEVTCRGDEIVVKVNDDLVNHATNCNVTEGAISLQSEGAPVEFRKVELKPLP
jgi:hypothetical protein